MQKSIVETVFTGNDAPFLAAVNRAEKHAQGFQSRVQSMFRRTPERRAETAISQFFGDLGSGNVQGALAGLTSKITGFGLAAGVGIGVAVETFIRAKSQIDEVDKSVSKLNQDLARPPGLQAGLGPEGIGKEMETTQKDLEDVVEKRKGFFQRIREAAIRGQPDIGGDPYSSDAAGPTNRVPAASKAQIEAGKRLKELARDRADAELDVVKARDISLNKSEEEGALFKLRLDTQQRLSKLGLEEGPNKPGRDQAVFFKRIAGINADERLSTDEIGKRADLRKAELEMEGKVNALVVSGKTAEEQKTDSIKLRLGYLKEELAATKDPLKRKAIQNQIDQSGDEEALNDYKRRNEPGSALYTPERGEQQNFLNFMRNRARTGGNKDPHFDMSGNLIPNPGYANSPDAYSVAPQGGDGGPKPFSADVFHGGGHMQDHPFVQAITHMHKDVVDTLDHHLSPDDGSSDGSDD